MANCEVHPGHDILSSETLVDEVAKAILPQKY